MRVHERKELGHGQVLRLRRPEVDVKVLRCQAEVDHRLEGLEEVIELWDKGELAGARTGIGEVQRCPVPVGGRVRSREGVRCVRSR